MANDSTLTLDEGGGAHGDVAVERLVAMLCSEVHGLEENTALRGRVAAIFEDHCLEEAAKTPDSPRPKF